MNTEPYPITIHIGADNRTVTFMRDGVLMPAEQMIDLIAIGQIRIVRDREELDNRPYWDPFIREWTFLLEKVNKD